MNTERSVRDAAFKEALFLLSEASKLQHRALELIKEAIGLPGDRRANVVTSIKLSKHQDSNLVCAFCSERYPFHKAGCSAGPHYEAKWISADHAVDPTLATGYAPTHRGRPEALRAHTPVSLDRAIVEPILIKSVHGGRVAPVVEFKSRFSDVVGEG